MTVLLWLWLAPLIVAGIVGVVAWVAYFVGETFDWIECHEYGLATFAGWLAALPLWLGLGFLLAYLTGNL